MGKPEIPTALALRLHSQGLTWKQVSEKLKEEGYPADPFPAYQATSLYAACTGRLRRKRNAKPRHTC